MSGSSNSAASAAIGEYRGASAGAIRHHYDVGNEFYALWLDPTLTYSCALWERADDTLQTAQERKLDHLARASGAHGARHVIDIGCGWGGMLRRLVERHEVGRAVGLTLSAAQHELVSQLAHERCEARLENWAEHEPTAPYDAIVSIGAFEHFAEPGLPREQRVAEYRRFFDRCHDWLVDGGRLALQTNVKGDNVRLDRRTTRELLFIARHIFPESELPWLSEIVQASERRLRVVSVRNDPDHYVRTCKAWRERLMRNRRAASELVGARVVADYERYLRSSVEAFERRHLGLARIVFERV
jgi:cyclopropane-fatty-acyl-phospholipid synthase